ncbi:hypothetical protein OYC64_020536 [Pagothenia borchgrevinki]|uniref:Interleukin n=1 Tax=Pagothenia borchgrevinki TaxID=8213 RepID=A0ABD2FM62_PAGBO
MMKMMVMVFLSAATLMFGPAVAKPYVPLDNLKVVIDKIDNWTGLSTKKIWVEDLTSLTGECKDKFFCKSFEILNKTKHHSQEEEVLLRNLKAYIVGTHANCTEGPKEETEELISQLRSKILYCARRVHMRGNVTTPTPEAQPPVDQPSA